MSQAIARGGLFARQCRRPSADFQQSQHAGVTEPQVRLNRGKVKDVRQCLDRTERRTREAKEKTPRGLANSLRTMEAELKIRGNHAQQPTEMAKEQKRYTEQQRRRYRARTYGNER